LGGGGTDLPSYYRDHGGSLVAAAIDKYVYITLHNTFQPGYILKYSELERVERAGDIRSCAAIELVGTDDRIEMAGMADIPAGTGLGSSGSFATALLRALHTRQRNVISPHTLAEQACHIEITCFSNRSASRTSSSPRMAALPVSCF
jgi:D-glycero-alpha-D-manno-heptose-7-phosphate kinase